MPALPWRYLRYLMFPLACCAAGLAIVLGLRGPAAAWIALVLLLLEISLSFDNAVVNARVLDRLTPGQQRFFLTWGLVIPVFGVRFAGPLLMVALAGGVGIGEALDAALHHPQHYRELLELAEPRILAFGGMFLLMVFLRYFFDEAKTLHWFRPLERRLSAAGRIEALEIALALIILLVLDAALPGAMRAEVMIAGVIGLVLQLLSTSLSEAFGDEEQAGARLAAGGGLASLLYLELLDASFSLDGTIGAFAITSDLSLILTGLGLGALFIRSLTLMLSRERALDQLVYLEHGAHYAIGALGLLMLAGIWLHEHGTVVPEWLTGLVGIVLLVLSFADSLRQRRGGRDALPVE
ncbi:MAG: DUF475 domain-containing protein [Cyanobacteriota bacterium]|nr:DUF475 domain-containing protein [Cyanobacteriota bacterium]